MAIGDNTSYELFGYQIKDLPARIKSKAEASSLASVATSGLYSDLIGAPTIPTVYNGTLTITQNGTSAGTFTANASSNATIALTDTTYSDFVGTDGLVAGSAGLVPAPATTDDGKFLKADGTWDSVPSGGWKHILYVDDSQNESPWQTQSYPSWFRIFTDANLTQDLDVNDLQSILADGPTLAAITTVNKRGTTYYAVVNSVVGGAGGQAAYISLTTFDNANEGAHPAQYLFYTTAQITQTTYYWGANKKTSPTVNNATLTIQHNGTSVQTFTANSSTNKTANIETIYADDAIDTSAIGAASYFAQVTTSTSIASTATKVLEVADVPVGKYLVVCQLQIRGTLSNNALEGNGYIYENGVEVISQFGAIHDTGVNRLGISLATTINHTTAGPIALYARGGVGSGWYSDGRTTLNIVRVN